MPGQFFECSGAGFKLQTPLEAGSPGNSIINGSKSAKEPNDARIQVRIEL